MKDTPPLASGAVEHFHRLWSNFVLEYPELRNLLDPHYVIFDFAPVEESLGVQVSVTGPPNWNNALLYLPHTGLNLANIQQVQAPNQYMYSLTGGAAVPMQDELNARQFGGVMQGYIQNNLRYWEFSLPVPPFYR